MRYRDTTGDTLPHTFEVSYLIAMRQGATSSASHMEILRIRLPYCTCLPSKKRTVRLVCLACASLWVTITMVRPSSLLSW